MSSTNPVPSTTSNETQSIASPPDMLSPTASGAGADERRGRCINALRIRARNFTLNAIADAGLVFVALVFMSNTFALADKLSQVDESMSSLSRDIKTQAENQSAFMKRRRIADEQLINELNKIKNDSQDPARLLKEISRVYELHRVQLADAEKDVDHLLAPIIFNQAQASDNRFLIQTASTFLTRFGILICGFFLIRILVSRYIFNSRLASQYAAMADALELASDWGTLKFDELIRALTPRTEFGPVPKPMVQDLANLAVRATENIKKG